MGVFEYVSVLTSIVIGMGIAHLLRGVARVIQHRGRGTSDWVHLIWVAFMFFQAIFFWWWEWFRWRWWLFIRLFTINRR